MPTQALFLGTALGFLASAALVATTLLPRPEGDGPTEQDTLRERTLRGARLFVRIPSLTPVLTLNLTVAAAMSFVLVHTVVLARSSFGLDDAGRHQHLAKLRAHGLVQSRREGTTIHYRQPDWHLAQLVTNILHHTEHARYEEPPHHRGR